MRIETVKEVLGERVFNFECCIGNLNEMVEELSYFIERYNNPVIELMNNSFLPSRFRGEVKSLEHIKDLIDLENLRFVSIVDDTREIYEVRRYIIKLYEYAMGIRDALYNNNDALLIKYSKELKNALEEIK